MKTRTLNVQITFREPDSEDDSSQGSFEVLQVTVTRPDEPDTADEVIQPESSPYSMGGMRFWTLYVDDLQNAGISLTEDIA